MRFRLPALSCGLLLVLLGFAPVQAQPNAATMTLTDLQRTAIDLVGNANYVSARPYLEELVNRFQGEDKEIRARLEVVYFYLGIGYLIEYGQDPRNEFLVQAVEWLERLEKEFPAGQNTALAHLAIGDSYRGLQEWEKARDTYLKMMEPPLVSIVSVPQRLEALEKLAQALYILEEWEDGEPWFRALLRETRDPDVQALAASALMESFINRGMFAEAIRLFPLLVGESPSRYKLGFNVALIEAGDRLAGMGRFSEAMLMYRMVLTLEEITVWQENRLQRLSRRLDLLRLSAAADSEAAIALDAEIYNTRAQLEAIAEIPSYTPDLRVRIARNYLLTGRDWESFWAYRELLADFPDHPNREDFIYATFTGATNLGLGEEVIAIGESYLNDPTMEKYKSDISIKLAQFYLEEGRYSEFFQFAENFIESDPENQYNPQMVYLMGSTYMRQFEFAPMIRIFNNYLERFPAVPMVDGLSYWVGMGHLFEQEYEKGIPYFKRVLDNYSGSVYFQDALYRMGVCLFGMQNFAQAREVFEQFISEYPGSPLRGEVEFFLGDVEAAEPNVAKALQHYANVEQYTDNLDFISRSYFSAGELLEANKRYEEMVELYERFINTYRDSGNLTGAVYHLGRTRELQGRPDQMLEEYWRAIQRFGNIPTAYGMDLIIEAYPERYYSNLETIEANLTFLEKLKEDKAFREEINRDRRALFRHLADNPKITEEIRRPFYDAGLRRRLVNDTAVLDADLERLRGLREQYPTTTPEEQFKKAYAEAQEAGERTLALRLQLGLDRMGSPINPDEVFTEVDFPYGSPAALIWMGNRNREFDAALSRQAYNQVIEQHGDSELVLDALLALGELEMEQGDAAAALRQFEAAENKYPADDHIYRAVLRQGDALLQMGDPAGARERFERVLGNRNWRGRPHAEAVFKIGMSYYNQQQFAEALPHFERTLIGFSGFTDWAAMAYLYGGRSFERTGQPQDAIRLYDEFLNSPQFANTEQFREIEQARAAL